MLSEKESCLSTECRDWIKKNKKVIFDKFANIELFPGTEKPTTFFMAGSPGAGKTEFSKNFIIELSDYIKYVPANAVRIDADEIREIIPGYTGKNSYVIQSAANLGVEKLYDFTLKNKQNIILDGTFANYDLSCDNVNRSLDKDRGVGIFYLYQDPLLAWDFTKQREKLEGRYVPKDIFVDAFFAAKDNVNRAKQEFQDKIIVFLIEKNYKNNVKKKLISISAILTII